MNFKIIACAEMWLKNSHAEITAGLIKAGAPISRRKALTRK
jgi:hypothetical protein